MKPFAYLEPDSIGAAVEMLQAGGSVARVIAGGSDLLGELKEQTVHYERLVSLARIEALRGIEARGSGLVLGAGVTLAEIEHDPRLTGPYGILPEAARGVATPEIRNQGTLGGNLCQRPRCLHYRSPWVACLKKGGADCPALESRHQNYLSVMGGTGCHSVHASDLAPPLMALEAEAVVAGADGERSLPLAEFFVGPEVDVHRENILAPAEILAAVVLPTVPAAWHGTYVKARERTAGDFPLVSVAFGCAVLDGGVRNPRLVLGGVAPKPLRCPGVEALLEGQAPSPELAARAAETAFVDAAPLAHNGFKLEIGRALVARVIGQVTG
jgi:xanthine dehydrogenase YagS FAD-binding subunit